jgi:Jag N-terminus
MKSIMEEASSITKAIENAWSRAGHPQEFSVKILEHPKTSFFGLKTAKSAKIALFFQEAAYKTKEPSRQTAHTYAQRNPKPSQDLQRRPLQRTPERTPESHAQTPPSERRYQPRSEQPRSDQRRAPASSSRYRDSKPYASRHESAPSERPERNYESRESWTPEMVEAAQDWIKETLVMMGKPDISLNANVSNNYLKIALNQPVIDDPRQEETQLKSWGSLAMEAVREKTNKPLRGLRIILATRK